MRIRQQLVTSRDRTSPGHNPGEYLTFHETDNRAVGAGAAAHANLQSSGNVRQASWHLQGDDTEIVRSFPPEVRCWHAGDGDGPGNFTSESYEICVNPDSDYAAALALAAAYGRDWRRRTGHGRDRIVQHSHWSGKNCPRVLRGMGPQAWAAFVASTDPEEETSMSDVLISPFEGRLTSRWGWREILGRPLTFHRGQDIAPPVAGSRGLPVYAPCDLEIVYVSAGTYSKAQGKWLGNDYTGTWNTGPVVVARGRGKWSSYWFLFGHMVGITVKADQKVSAGHLLGKADDQGNVQGVHLHFEIWTSSKQGGGNAAGNTIDPAAFYARHGVRLGSAPDLTKTPTRPLPDGSKEMFTVSQYDNIMAELGKIKVAVGRVDPGEGATLLGELRKLPAAIAKAVAEFTDPGSSMTLWARIKRIQDRGELTNTAVGQMAPRVAGIANTVGAPAVDATSIAAQVVDLIGDQLDQVVKTAVTNAVGDLPARDLEQIVAAARADLRTRLED